MRCPWLLRRLWCLLRGHRDFFADPPLKPSTTVEDGFIHPTTALYVKRSLMHLQHENGKTADLEFCERCERLYVRRRTGPEKQP